jgi:site-specific recombinase XerC
VQAAIRHYLHQLKFDQEASEHTLQAYQTDLQQFLAVITTQAGSAITPNELNDVLIRRFGRSFNIWVNSGLRGFLALHKACMCPTNPGRSRECWMVMNSYGY